MEVFSKGYLGSCVQLYSLAEALLRPIEIDTLEYQQTEKIETELKDVDRIH
jgi:hypothetical protein